MNIELKNFISKCLEIKKLENNNKFFSLDLLKKTDNLEWELAVRYLESKGFSVAVITDKNKYGVFIAEGFSENNRLKGWGLENHKPLEICVKNIGFPLKSEKPEAPDTKIQGLKVVPTHSIAVLFGTKDNGWGKVEHIPQSSFSLSIMNTGGIQYGQSAFEGACAMKNEQGEVFGFRLEKNTERFNKSIQAIGLPEIDVKIVREMIEVNIQNNKDYVPELGDGQLYIRPSVAGLTGALGIVAAETFIITSEVAAFGSYIPTSIKVEGLRYIHRPYSGTSKIAPNYSVSVKIKQGVKARGYSDYLSYDIDNNVEEVSSCAVAFIDKENNFVFPPVQDEIDTKERHILPSITRYSIIELLEFQKESVIIRDVNESEVKNMKAMFTMGNAVGVVEVSELSVKKSFSSFEISSSRARTPSFLAFVEKSTNFAIIAVVSIA
ncbi:TPA: hypothetical protein EYP45_01320, partial [Candidatus Peregrinibacteria bacterium]|nr:hypothetical protein [Candidatus Peregrinibacteria bacterium]